MKKTLLFIALLSFLCTNAGAWGREGHEVAAKVAENHLQASAKKKIEKYLGGHSIVYYAKWMDEYRRTPEFAFTNDWHIVYLDDKLQYNPTPSKPANGDCIYGIEGAIEVLKNYKQYNDSIVALNLKYIIHMVADMHCPAHIKYEGRDQNHFVTLTDYYKKKKKLKIHFVWDAAAIQETRIFSSTEWAREIDIYSKKEIKEFCKGTPREWLHSNAVRCLKQFDLAYPDAEIGQDFLNEAMPFIEEQLAIAGYRIAHLLNELF
jgi:hypothetical protein